jgi:hypothetical protein
MGVGLVVTVLHPYRQPRFLFTTALLVWLLAARQVVGLVDRALATRAMPGVLREGLWAAALVALLAAGLLAAPPLEATRAGHRALLAPAAIGPVLDRVLDHAQRLNERPTLLGHWNGMSPALLRWQQLLESPGLLEARLPKPAPWLPADAAEIAIAARIEAFRRDGSPLIAAVSDVPFPGATGEYWQETASDRATVARLMADPGVVVERRDELNDSGFRIATFRFVGRGDAAGF